MGELGSLLTRAREARGLTIEDAERDTRISRRYLQALEAEQFEVIPAPVYARGFLRSYSQYLGLDPQETLSLFPREDAPSPYYAAGGQPQTRAASPTPRAGPPPPPASRPTWRRQSPQGVSTGTGAARPAEAGWEPTIGVDIGVPAPARRIKTDPAAQTRSMTVLVVAIGTIIVVVLMALAISRLGDDSSGALSPLDRQTATPTEAGSIADETPEASATEQTSTVTAGVMPDVTGLSEGAAKDLIISAGADQNAISVTSQPHSAAKGTVYDQYPPAGGAIEAGQQIILAVSEGQ